MNLVIERDFPELPFFISRIFNYVKNLGFKQTPDYDFILKLIKSEFENNNFDKDYEYDWCFY